MPSAFAAADAAMVAVLDCCCSTAVPRFEVIVGGVRMVLPPGSLAPPVPAPSRAAAAGATRASHAAHSATTMAINETPPLCSMAALPSAPHGALFHMSFMNQI